MVNIACAAPYGAMGLGHHLAQVVEEARANGDLERYFALAARPGDPAGLAIRNPWLPWLLACPPVRYLPGWQHYLSAELFDRAVAARLGPGDAFTGFSGQALHALQRARRLGYRRLTLEAATAHVDQVRRRHDQARLAYPIERDWLGEGLRRRTCLEYALADSIVVTSQYSRRSFLAAGVGAEKLVMRSLAVDDRFRPSPARPADGVFRVVYTGGLTVVKGIPILLEAFAGLGPGPARLTLVGGWASGGMRRYLQEWLARDPRIRVAPGDPLPHLQQADAYVQPSYQDGFGLAAAEALACGVPVIATVDTGMAERLREGVNGYVVPTGDPYAILARLEELRRRPLAAGASLLEDIQGPAPCA